MELPFDPEMKKMLSIQAKKHIRGRMRALRQSHPRSGLEEKSRAIVRALLDHEIVRAARAVALFWPMLERSEIDLRDLDEELRVQGKAVYYPVLEPSERGHFTGFRLSESRAELEARDSTFAQPPKSARLADRGDLDVVIVPALAADARGHRIGYGKGFYDVTLPDVCPPAKSIIVVYDFQLEGELPDEEHDRPADYVVTDKRVLVATS